KDQTLCICGEDVPLRKLKQHQATSCTHRLIQCPHHGCDLLVAAYLLRDHELKDCKIYRQTQAFLDGYQVKTTQKACCLACEEEIMLRNLEGHCKLECIYRLVNCPNAALGCNAINIVWNKLREHYINDCHVAKHRAAMLEASKTVNQIVDCDWCNLPVMKRHLTDHKEDECLMRERQCPNWHLGCREWIPVGDFTKHIQTVCCVSINRHELSKQAAVKEKSIPCRECGEVVVMRKMTMHASKQCSARLVPCANAIHGCKAMLKYRDRHIHEHVDLSPHARSILRFTSRQGRIDIQAGEDISPPWCAEFWVYLFSKEDDILHFMAHAIEWHVKYSEVSPRLDKWMAEEKSIKDKIKMLLKRKKGTPEEDIAALQQQALVVEDGIGGCKSIMNEAKARIQSLLSDSEILLRSIKNPTLRDKVKQSLQYQTRQLQPSWSQEDVEVYGSVEKWLEKIKAAAATEKDMENPHAKLIKKRLQLLKAIEDHERSPPKDLRESARFLKQARKELTRLDEKLCTCVDIPLALAVAPIGFHTIASSKTSGIHIVMSSGNAVLGLHSFDKKARFQCEVPREQWTHIAISALDTSVQVCLNGELVDEHKGHFQLPMERIGDVEKSYRGFLQEVRYWTTNRTPDAIKKSMCNTLNPSVQSQLRAYWSFEEGVAIVRSPMWNISWSHYTLSILKQLGDPPTPSYRQRNMCSIVTRRNFLASKHEMRQLASICALGCGAELPRSQLEHHHACDCPQRLVLCPEPGCKCIYKISQTEVHRAECIVRVTRGNLAAEHYRQHEVVECPFGCGLPVVRKDLVHHRRNDCPCRFIMCPNKGCGRSYLQRNAKRHELHDCDAPGLLAKQAMIERARERMTSDGKLRKPEVPSRYVATAEVEIHRLDRLTIRPDTIN
ncbi:hypothetical protein THRCLA_01649, partial [Thraustotheca clavata]